MHTGSQLCCGALTLDENTHIPTAKVDVIGNLTPVNARVVPMERSQEKQGAVDYFHPFWHLAVQPRAQGRRHTHLNAFFPSSSPDLELRVCFASQTPART